MNSKLLQCLLFSVGLMLVATAHAELPAPCGISAAEAADGSVKLSNAEDPKCDVPAAVPAAAPAAPASAPDSAASATTDTPVVSTRTSGRALDASAEAPTADPSNAQPDAPKDPRERYRDAMVLGSQSPGAGNPAVSRRYKAMDKATYQAKVLGGVAPGSQVDGQTSGLPGQ